MRQVYDTLLTRRSCRSYTDQPISAEDMQTILRAGVYAPSAMNRQGRQLTVVRTKSNMDALAVAMGRVLARPDYHFYHPVALVIVSDEPGNPNNGFDCACALENMFLMAHALGIGSCWINQMKDAENDPEVRGLLSAFGVPADHHVYGMAALGYAAAPSREADKSAQVVHFAD